VRLATFSVVLLLCGGAAATSLEDSVGQALRDEGLVGASWALVDAGTITTGAAGRRDARRDEPLAREDRVQVGSIAKTLVALGVLRLVSEGRLSLDAPVAELLPALAIENPWAQGDPVRVRHLMDHTSGLDDARLSQVFSLRASPDTPLSESVGSDPSQLRVRFRPGAWLSYSNLGYTLLGMVIEAVTRERYEAYLDAHLLRPLGMHQSTFRFVSQASDARLVMGHFEQGATQATVPSYLRPAGQLTTTAGDMGLFARFLMGNGEVDGVPFVDPRLLRSMGRPTTTEAVAAGLEAGYGLGLNRRDRHGVLGNCHVGTTVGFRSSLCIFPAEQKAFFIAFNTDSEGANYERFDAALVRELALRPVPPTRSAEPPGTIAAWEGIYVLAPIRNESFAYLDVTLNFATVRWDGSHLHLRPFQSAAKSLAPVGGMLLRSQGQAAASHVLLAPSGGRQAISDGFRTYERVSPWRIVPLWLSLAAGLAGLAYVVLVGCVRVARRRLARTDPLFVPFIASLSLVLPMPFFLGQSFLRLGELTPASLMLAFVTAALPAAMALGLWRRSRRGVARAGEVFETFALLAVLQWAAVLAYWGLVPLRLWVI
jgi:CubicO group peptidase (beta-lactamase class C family)